MFSVPGWNVSAPLATQVEKPRPVDTAKLGKKAQKRKRKVEEQIDAGNVGEYWDKIIGGDGGKNAPMSAANTTITDEAAGEGAGEKRAKKKRRKNKDGSRSKDDASPVASIAPDSKPPSKDSSAAPAAPQPPTPERTDSDRKRDKKKRKKDRKPDPNPPATTAPTIPLDPTDPAALLPEPKGLTPLQKSMRQKLASARFRHLNEALYTTPSTASLSLFAADPSMFEDYHRGFAQQVQVWPENPVDGYIATILARGRVRSPKSGHKQRRGAPQDADSNSPADTAAGAGAQLKPLPRNSAGTCTIADLGCGTASLAYRLQPHLAPLRLALHSFDLAQPAGPSGPLVTVADIARLPLPDASVDVGIFCLALMGTNWLDFVDEAYRVLRWRGELWVAEIKSRFGRVERRKGEPPVNSVGGLKKKGKGGKKGDGGGAGIKPGEEGIQDSEDEAELVARVDGGEAQTGGTDVSAFTSILLRHGFALDARPERMADAVDLENKMFVKMAFTKSVAPVVGKNAKPDAAGERDSREAFGPRAAAGMRGGKPGLRMGMKGKKFAAVSGADGEEDEQDAKVLKPCLYKIR